MGSRENKQLIQDLFDPESEVGTEAFLEALADDYRHTLIGTTPLSGTYVGKQTFIEKFLGPVLARFETAPTIRADEIIAEGDFVVVVAHGEGGVSKTGKAYDNTYCHVYRFADGKIRESTEYCDTALIESALAEPGSD